MRHVCSPTIIIISLHVASEGDLLIDPTKPISAISTTTTLVPIRTVIYFWGYFQVDRSHNWENQVR